MIKTLLTIMSIAFISSSAVANTLQSDHLQPNESEPSYMAQDKTQSIEIRSAALEHLKNIPSNNALIAIARALKEDNTQLNKAAIVGSEGLPIEYRWTLLFPYLDNELPTLKNAAVYSIVKNYEQLNPKKKRHINNHLPELEEYYLNKTDSFSTFKLAEVYRLTNQTDKAIDTYIPLTETIADNPAIWIGLSETYRLRQDSQGELDTLIKGIKSNPRSSQLYYAKALTLIRQGNKLEARSDMNSAANLAKTNGYYWYLYALIQKEFEPESAIELFEQAYAISALPEYLYSLCEIYIETQNKNSDRCVEKLIEVAPESFVAQLRELDSNR